MKIVANQIVSNSEMIKNYKTCRDKAESSGKIFIFKNNQPDAVLLSIQEYDKFSTILEYMEKLDSGTLSEMTEIIFSQNKVELK